MKFKSNVWMLGAIALTGGIILFAVIQDRNRDMEDLPQSGVVSARVISDRNRDRKETPQSDRVSSRAILKLQRDPELHAHLLSTLQPDHKFRWDAEWIVENLMKEFDREVLAKPFDRLPEDQYHLSSQILRAAAAKDASFQHLLEDKRLLNETRTGLALKIYDFNINGNEKALDQILEENSLERLRSDSSTIVALAYADEWDKSIISAINHFPQGLADGAATTSLAVFWHTRRVLFPEKFKQLLAAEN